MTQPAEDDPVDQTYDRALLWRLLTYLRPYKLPVLALAGTAISAALSALACWISMRPARSDSTIFALQYAQFLLLMVLAVPAAWMHYETLLVLVFNGVLLGAVAGYLHAIGYGRTFFPFVAGHAAFELTALVLVGAAGLKLGLALVAPGRLRRSQALREAAAAALPLVYGSALMLVVAAAIEAFWSPRTGVPMAAKLGVAGGLWGMVAVWLMRGGRGGER